MSSITIIPSNLRGRVQAVPSKSVAHRALICAFLSGKPCTVDNLPLSKDIEATVRVLESFGAVVEKQGSSVKFLGFTHPETAVADCGESGSTLRFTIPVAAALGVNTRFIGGGRLPLRTLEEYVLPLEKSGVHISFEQEGRYLPAVLNGKMKGDCFEIDGSVSSQFITGLLLACPLMGRDVKIKICGKMASAPYIDITADVMKYFGVGVEKRNNGFFVEKGSYTPEDYTVEGDWSSAAFWVVARKIGCNIELLGLNHKSKQGDRRVCEIIDEIYCKDSIIDCGDVPDLVPVLAVGAALCSGRITVFTGCARLRHKESDRLSAIYENLSALGADIEIDDDSITIVGKKQLIGGTVKGFNDHRIVMSMAIAAIGCKEKVTVSDGEAVAKSYPHFFDDYTLLGGKIL